MACGVSKNPRSHHQSRGRIKMTYHYKEKQEHSLLTGVVVLFVIAVCLWIVLERIVDSKAYGQYFGPNPYGPPPGYGPRPPMPMAPPQPYRNYREGQLPPNP